MELKDEQIAKFQMLYRKHFGKNISKDEALDKGRRLIHFIEIISKAIVDKKNSV